MSLPVEYIDPPGTAPAQGLYAHIGLAPSLRLMFIAGQLSVDLDGNVVGRNDFTSQFHQVFGNLADVLKGAGADFNSILKFTTYFVRSQDIEAFMHLRREVFPTLFKGDKFPPNTIVVVDRLVKEDFLFEVEAIAQVEG